MKLKDWLGKWNMTSLRINAKFLELELQFNDADKNAAWELYTELLTRVTTQYLQPEHGDEKRALESIYEIFPLTREIVRRNGRQCIEFSKIGIVVLNQVIRPFTAKWHGLSLQGAFENPKSCEEFRKELRALQQQLRNYTKMLSGMVGVEDLTDLESI